MAGLTVLDHGGRVRRMTIESPMIFALQEAERAAARGEVPVGAVLVNGDSGEILARAGNQPLADSDPTAHAEMLATLSERPSIVFGADDICDRSTAIPTRTV